MAIVRLRHDQLNAPGTRGEHMWGEMERALGFVTFCYMVGFEAHACPRPGFWSLQCLSSVSG
jgi:hypothetical protein